MTGALWYPGADTKTQNFVNRWPGDIMPHTNVLLLHSTESSSWPTYDRGEGPGEVAPNATYHRGLRKIRQHFPANMSSRALKHTGNPPTNTLNVFQLEMVGTCDPATHAKYPSWPFTPDADDEWIDDIAHLWLWLNQEWSVPLTALPASRWVAYPASYGLDAKQRMSAAEWLNFEGVCAHQHCPENDHGDAGAWPIAKLLARVNELAAPTKPKHPAFPNVEKATSALDAASKELAAAAKLMPKQAAVETLAGQVATDAKTAHAWLAAHHDPK